MIKFENIEVVGWEHTIRGMRNPKNSWDKSDSVFCGNIACDECRYLDNHSCPGNDYDLGLTSLAGTIGPNDHNLMMSLAAGGPVHAKYRRMIAVYLDITAPLYWWKEFDTYKVGTVANSCSTMHKIHAKEFTLGDFSYEYLFNEAENSYFGRNAFSSLVADLNRARELYLKTNDKKYWWQMIQLLPSSYNQKRTIMLNYEVLVGIYKHRKNHKLDEWHDFCKMIEELPYSEIITGEEE